MHTPYILNNVPFEKYLRVVLQPKEYILWPEGCPEILTPPFDEAERLYCEHNPQEQGQMGRVNYGYEWLWQGFKEEVESNAINLRVSETDRLRYLRILSDWFGSLESEKENYQLLLDALRNYKIPVLTDSSKWGEYGEIVPDHMLDYVLHGEGTSQGRAKVGLDWCICIIDEGKKIVDYYLQHYTPATSTPPPVGEDGLSVRQRMLIYCYEQKPAINKGERGYNDYIIFATPRKRMAYPNESDRKAKWLAESIEKILPHLSEKVAQQAENEMNTILENI